MFLIWIFSKSNKSLSLNSPENRKHFIALFFHIITSSWHSSCRLRRNRTVNYYFTLQQFKDLIVTSLDNIHWNPFQSLSTQNLSEVFFGLHRNMNADSYPEDETIKLRVSKPHEYGKLITPITHCLLVLFNLPINSLFKLYRSIVRIVHFMAFHT